MNLDRFRGADETPPMPLTALVDVLFLMIIFLVLGASFDAMDTVQLPQATGGPALSAEQSQRMVRLELRADGSLWLDQQPLNDTRVLAALRERNPRVVLLLPDGRAPVARLFYWHEQIVSGLGVPVQVGVRPPAKAPAP